MLPQIASRLYGTPLLIHPDKAQVIAWALQDKLGLEVAEPGGPEASRFTGSRRRGAGNMALTRATNGAALITVEGTLVNRGAWLDSRSGLTSYEGLAAQFADAGNDPEIHAIVSDIDSPGGEATGMFKLAATIREVRKKKPVIAVVDDVAASAAYGIASAATEIVISPTSMIGSIGVVWLHLDRSGELAQKGIHPTLIYAGAHKVDANSFGPLTERAAADTQQLIDKFYARFVETVAAGRGARTTAQRARETEARVYIGRDAIAAGLADRVASLDQVLEELSSKSGHKSASATPTVRSESDARLIAIMSLPEARGREQEAAALARAGKSVDEARRALVAAKRQRTTASWRKAFAAAGLQSEDDK